MKKALIPILIFLGVATWGLWSEKPKPVGATEQQKITTKLSEISADQESFRSIAGKYKYATWTPIATTNISYLVDEYITWNGTGTPDYGYIVTLKRPDESTKVIVVGQNAPTKAHGWQALPIVTEKLGL